MLGFLYTNLQAYDKARLHFRIALVKDPNDKEAAESLKVLAARQSNDEERRRLEKRLRGLLPKPRRK